MPRITLILTLFLASLPLAVRAAEPVTLQSLLAEMVDRDAIARLPSPNFQCLQASSYDRAQTDPNDPKTWFANHDYGQFIRTETNDGRKEWVIMEHEGPGAIVRFWTPLNRSLDQQIIRFYFDGAKTPGITAKLNDLMRGRLFVKPPFAFIATDEKKTDGVAGDLYLPIPFAKGCKITLDSLPFYYNINYRAYDKGTEVKTFTMEEFEKAGEQLKKTADALHHVKQSNEAISALGLVAGDASSGPLSCRPISLKSASGGAIRTLEVRIDPKDASDVLRSAVLTAMFDGENTVWCPLGEFFGCGERLRPLNDRDRSVETDGTLTARWIMPYEKSVFINIEYYGKKKPKISFGAGVANWRWDDRSMHFHATWRHEYPINTKARTGTMDWNYLEAKGQGVYVGDTLTVFSQSPAWYGEGDERVYFDGGNGKLPQHMGTGTEDYYGYAWGMASEFSSPWLSMPRRDRPNRDDWRGYTTTSRVRLLDQVPFQKSLKFDMEIWDWAKTKVAYSAATFWYARPGATSNRQPMPDEAAAPIPELKKK